MDFGTNFYAWAGVQLVAILCAIVGFYAIKALWEKKLTKFIGLAVGAGLAFMFIKNPQFYFTQVGKFITQMFS